MREENGDDTRFPEHMELERCDLILDSEQLGDEVCDISIDRGIKLEDSDKMENSSKPEEEACDITIERGGMEADIGDEKDSDGSVEETTDLFEEEGGVLSNNGDSQEVMTRKTPSSTENSSTDGQVRKKPTAFIIGANHKFNVRSRYLSSPIGSCHDFCKHGHRRESEEKTSPFSGMIGGGRVVMHSVAGSKSASKEETKKKTYLRRLSLPGPTQGKHGKLISEDLNNGKKDFNKSTLKKLQSEIKPSSVPIQQTSRSKTDVQPSNKKVVVQNLSLVESSSLDRKTRKQAESHSSSEKAKEPMRSSFSPTLLKKSPSMKARLYKNLKSLSFSNPGNRSNSKEARIDGSGDVPEKTLYMIEPDTDKTPAKRPSRFALSNTSLPSSWSGSRVNKGNNSKGNQKVNHIGQPESDSINTKTKDGGSKSNMPRTKSPLEDGRSKPNTPRAKSNVEHGRSKPKSTVGTGGSKLNTPIAKLAKGGRGGGSKPSTPRAKSAMEKLNGKGKGISAEEKDGSAWKVKFKKGTVVALQVANSAPKKLLFKRARILGEDQIGKGEVVRSLKNREHRGKESHDTKQPESRNVRLRHQEAASKKDTVDLNNVIEETASQLVKTRKSKVQALVGAFETVMSLRGPKPMVETAVS